jgi:hypothetical protein
MVTSTSFMWVKALLFFATTIAIVFNWTMANGQVSYSVDFSTRMVVFEKISTEDRNIYDKVEYTTLSRSNELGKPFLPVKYVKLIVPSAQEVESLKFDPEKFIIVPR